MKLTKDLIIIRLQGIHNMLFDNQFSTKDVAKAIANLIKEIK